MIISLFIVYFTSLNNIYKLTALRELSDLIRDSKPIDSKEFIFGNLSSPKKAVKDENESIYFKRKSPKESKD